MKLAIVGSRSFTDYSVLQDRMYKILRAIPHPTEIVSGGAHGADSLGARWARENNVPLVVYLPDWSKGRGAGFERNSKIVDRADRVVAFWDGESSGTWDTVRKAIAADKLVAIFPV